MLSHQASLTCARIVGMSNESMDPLSIWRNGFLVERADRPRGWLLMLIAYLIVESCHLEEACRIVDSLSFCVDILCLCDLRLVPGNT